MIHTFYFVRVWYVSVDGGEFSSCLFFQWRVLLGELLNHFLESQSLIVFMLKHLLPSLPLRLCEVQVICTSLSMENSVIDELFLASFFLTFFLFYTLMVCSHCPTLKRKKGGLQNCVEVIIVHWEDINTKSLRFCANLSVSVSLSVGYQHGVPRSKNVQRSFRYCQERQET